MKKLLILAALACSFAAYGQFNSGSVYFSGMTNANLGIDFVSAEGFTETHLPLNILIEGGYFIKNKLAVGGELDLNTSIHFSGGSSVNFAIGPNIRYYKVSDEDLQMYFYGNIFYGFQNLNYNSFGLKGGIGFDYFLTERLALELKGIARYERQVSSNPFGFDLNNFGIDISLGISVFFPSISFFDRT